MFNRLYVTRSMCTVSGPHIDVHRQEGSGCAKNQLKFRMKTKTFRNFRNFQNPRRSFKADSPKRNSRYDMSHKGNWKSFRKDFFRTHEFQVVMNN